MSEKPIPTRTDLKRLFDVQHPRMYAEQAARDLLKEMES